MKTEDLQRCDYVAINGIIRKVEQITQRKIGYHVIPNESRMHYARICEVEPIPITPRILEANGFQNAQFSSTFRINTNHFLEFNSEKELILWEEKSVIRFVTYCVRVDYVHELQQALKLCRIDKEIEL